MTTPATLSPSAASGSPALDVERQTKAKEYARLGRRLFVVDLALSGLLMTAWLVLGWSRGLEAWLLTITTNDWLVVAGFGALMGLFFTVVGLPLEYYSGFVVPHRYGQSTETLAGWVKDQVLGLGLSALLGLPMLEGVY